MSYETYLGLISELNAIIHFLGPQQKLAQLLNNHNVKEVLQGTNHLDAGEFSIESKSAFRGFESAPKQPKLPRLFNTLP